MQNIDTLVYGRWIIPVEPENRVLEEHAIALHEGKILELLPATEAGRRYRATEICHLERHALIPGLINTHTHAAMTLFRGLADDLPLMDWLHDHIWPAEQQWVSPEFVRDGVRQALAEMLRGGTTCFNDMYFFSDQVAEVAIEAGIRASIGLIVVDFPTPWAHDLQEYFSKGLQLHDRFRHQPLVRTAFAPHAPYTVSDAPLLRIAALAEELDVPIHMHVHETAHEVDEACERNGERPLRHLDRLGLLSPRLQAVHMTVIDAEEIARIAECGVHVVHCPHSNLKLASGLCPVQELRQAGLNVALGTDGAASNNTLDMFGEMRTAALLAKAVARDAAAIPAFWALRMATLNGAKALGLDDRIGSLTPGKSADLVAIDLSGVEAEPLYNPLSQLVYAAGRHQVSDVWVEGKRLLRDRRLLTIDEQAVLAKVREWCRKISAKR